MKNIISTLALCALATCGAPAYAQDAANCGPRQDVLNLLGEVFDESRILMSLSSEGLLTEFYANQTSGTWTIVVTTPTSVACIVSHGNTFHLTLGDMPHGGDDA